MSIPSMLSVMSHLPGRKQNAEMLLHKFQDPREWSKDFCIWLCKTLLEHWEGWGQTVVSVGQGSLWNVSIWSQTDWDLGDCSVSWLWSERGLLAWIHMHWAQWLDLPKVFPFSYSPGSHSLWRNWQGILAMLHRCCNAKSVRKFWLNPCQYAAWALC